MTGTRRGRRMLGLASATVALAAACVALPSAQRVEAAAPHDVQGQPYSPPLREPAENNLYFGDLHLHTNASTDAYLQGEVAVSAEDAFRFALGQTIMADSGQPARIGRPLDFLAVTDHAEFLGLYPALDRGDGRLIGSDLDRRWRRLVEVAAERGLRAAFGEALQSEGPLPLLPDDTRQSFWAEYVGVADRYNRPGSFTTLVGYEWTGMITGDNLHRVVLFRGGADETAGLLPYTANESNDPEDLWAALAGYEAAGADVLAIAHNGNVSNGRMFSPNRENGQPLDAAYAQTRARWEPVYEVTQVKGDGEAHPALSPADPFADFETWDAYNVAGSTPKEPWMLRYEYARQALRDGLRFERDLGTNPFQFGMIGSSDIHTGLSTVEEDNFFGKFPNGGPSAERTFDRMAGQPQRSWELGASGLTAIWAPENTREALFDALRRREVYATTGTRIRLRFFGGWDFAPGDIERGDFATLGYRQGVPMGGNLLPRSRTGAPTFLIQSARDPQGANLDRVQVVKGWLDAHGETHERIYDVAWSGERQRDAAGNLPPVGNTVDLASASYTNSIGAPELATWWRDPDFDPAQRAFYYVRVLEIPTPRWTAFDAFYFGITPPEGTPMMQQERAYSSPIWYTPQPRP